MSPSAFQVVGPFVALALLLALAFSTAGLASPLLALLPAVPVLAALLRGTAAGWRTAGAAALGLLVLGALEPPSASAATRAALLSIAGGLGVALVGYFERKLARLHDVLRATATRDELTGLANRTHLEDRLALEHHRLARHPESTLTLVLLDVDRFHTFNESHGHAAGDTCLESVAAAASKRVRRATDLLARYGGDQLLAVLPATTRGEAAAIAECIRRDVEALRPTVTASFGVAATHAEEGIAVDALLTRVEGALAESKAAGGNLVTAAD